MSLEGFDDAPRQISDAERLKRKEEALEKAKTPEGIFRKDVAEITRLGLDALDGNNPEELVKKLREMADSFEKNFSK